MSQRTDDFLDEIKNRIPTWQSPVIFLSYDRNALSVSLTEEERFWKYIPWSEFEDQMIDVDPCCLERLIPKLEKMTVKAKSALKDWYKRRPDLKPTIRRKETLKRL